MTTERKAVTLQGVAPVYIVETHSEGQYVTDMNNSVRVEDASGQVLKVYHYADDTLGRANAWAEGFLAGKRRGNP